MSAVFQTNFSDIPLQRRGKVRDVYDVETSLLIVATDRISAFDVIMSEPIDGKGEILTSISRYWFNQTQHIIKNHCLSMDVAEYPVVAQKYAGELVGRSMLCVKAKPLPIECVVRGYLAGSGWKEYQQTQTVCGVALPSGLVESSKLPQPIFTPATKADEGHDENISYEQAVEIVGEETAAFVRRVSIELYNFAAQEVEKKGLILADTKFEFGVLPNGSIILIDEVLTPDSSRYWLAEEYTPGKAQMNFDKQVLRDWLETQEWNKQAPAPTLPQEIIEKTYNKYAEAKKRIVG